MPPPSSSATTIVRSAGCSSRGPRTSPDRSWRKVRSPISATVRPGVASATPIAVDTVPSMPEAPRLAYTDTSGSSGPTSDRSRIALEAPTTRLPPPRMPRATARATCSPVGAAVSRCSSRTRSTASRARLSASSAAATQVWSTSQPVRTESASSAALPVGLGERGPASRTTSSTSGSASSLVTARCRVGRPVTTTCSGSSAGIASGWTGCSGTGAPGSATVGTPTRADSGSAPAPETTSVRRVRSTATAVTPGPESSPAMARCTHGRPSERPAGMSAWLSPASPAAGARVGAGSCDWVWGWVWVWICAGSLTEGMAPPETPWSAQSSATSGGVLNAVVRRYSSSPSAGTSGSRKAMSTCTGPGSASAVAVRIARPIAARQ